MKKYLADWHYKVVVTLVILIIAGLLWASFVDRDGRKKVEMLAGENPVEQIYAKNLTLNSRPISWMPEVEQGRNSYVGSHPYVEVDSVLANQLLEHKMPGSYRVDYYSTTVFLVDTSRTNLDSFAELLEGDAPVFFTSDSNLNRHLLSAVWATMGRLQDPTRQQLAVVLDELKTRYNDHEIIFDGDYRDYAKNYRKYPVAVMTDVQAADLISQGVPGKIVVPKDGTLTMGEGVFAAAGYKLPQVNSDLCRTAKLRTVDALGVVHAKAPFPAQSEYDRALVLSSQKWYPRVSQYAVSDYRRLTLGYSQLGPANALEQNLTYLGLIALAVIWGSWISWRSPTKRLSHLFISQVLLVVGFCLTRLIKFTAFGWGERYLWYTYYFFILANLTLLILITESVVGAKESRWERSGRISAIGNIFVVIFVLTNDYHHLVFRLGSPIDASDYTYGPGLVFVWVWVGLNVAYVFYRLMGYARYIKRTFKVGLWAIALGAVALLLLASKLGYWHLVTGLEVVMLQVVGMMLLSEFLIQTGLIPSNRKCVETFGRTTVPFYLLNDNWQVVNKTRTAVKIPDRIMRLFKTGETHIPAAPKLIRAAAGNSLDHSNSTDYRLLRLTQGYAVVEYDMLPVQLLREALEKTRIRLQEQYKTLEAEVYAHHQLEAAAAQRNIFLLVEDVMRQRLNLVDAHLLRVRELVGKHDAASQAELRMRLRLLGLHLGYCKRVGVAVLGNASGQTKDPAAELSHALLIACSDFSRDGDQAHIDLKTKGDFSINQALAVLDAFHSVLAAGLVAKANSVFATASITPEDWSLSALIGGMEQVPKGWVETINERFEHTQKYQLEYEDPDWRVILGGTHENTQDSFAGMRLSTGKATNTDGTLRDPLYRLREAKDD